MTTKLTATLHVTISTAEEEQISPAIADLEHAIGHLFAEGIFGPEVYVDTWNVVVSGITTMEESTP